jgi:hypothetical protein
VVFFNHLALNNADIVLSYAGFSSLNDAAYALASYGHSSTTLFGFFSNLRQPLSHAPQTIKSLQYIGKQLHIPNWREDIPPQAERKLPLPSPICFISGMHGE